MKFAVITMTPNSTGYYHPSNEEEFAKLIDSLNVYQGYKTLEVMTTKEIECRIAILGKGRD